MLFVGLAVLGTLRLVDSYNQSNQTDRIIHGMNVLVGEAKKCAANSASLGGGNGSFLGFSPSVRLAITPDMKLYSTAGTSWILIQVCGTITGRDGQTPVEVVGQFDNTADQWSNLAIVN
jgi:hypothetical protein